MSNNKPKELSAMTLDQLRKKATYFEEAEDFHHASVCYGIIWEREETDWSGFFYAKSLRKANRLKEARELHKSLRANYTLSQSLDALLRTEELWLKHEEDRHPTK